MVVWDDLGFRADYEVDVALEYPADGEWGIPEVWVASRVSTLRGGPQAIIRPKHGEPWLLSTNFFDVGGLYGTPDPRLICLVDRFHSVTLVDTTDPRIQTEYETWPVAVAASRDHQLLLISDWTSVTAIGIDGVRWRSEHLVLDDLRIVRADGDSIEYEGASLDPAVSIRGNLDAHRRDRHGRPVQVLPEVN